MAKIDLQEVKHAATGRWPEILQSVAGIDAAYLDGSTKEHPCPKCGGNTRFRMIDRDAGAVYCSHCFTNKNGDGLAAVMWMLGVSFADALKLVANHLGIRPGKQDRSPDSSLTWQNWSSTLVALWLAQKPGVKEEAFQLAGARMAKHRGHAVVALPVFGSSLDLAEPVNYVAVSASGGLLPTGTSSKPGDPVGKKVVGGKAAGLLNKHAMERLLTPGLVEVCWKVEGVTDMLALQSFIPEELRDRHVVVTTAFGAGEDPSWMAGIVAKAGKVYVLGDADEPGEAGARRWCRDVSREKKEGATYVTLPYAIEKTKGRDVRDFIVEGHTYDALLELAENGEQIVTERNDDGLQVANERNDTAFERKLLRDLQIEVLGMLENRMEKVKIYSGFHHESFIISDIARMNHSKLLMLCGPAAKEKVHTGNDDIEGMYSMREVQDAISLVAGYRRIEEGGERGIGIWPAKSLDGKDTNTIVLVNSRDAARFNGDRELRRVHSPRVDGLLLDLSAESPWYDFESFAATMKSAQSDEFCSQAVAEVTELFSRWIWRNQETDPLLMAGLSLAAWVQTIWPIRPLVAIEGESRAGKSTLFKALTGEQGVPGGLFGSLSMAISKPSEAGLRQAVGNGAQVVSIDEFEENRNREAVLKTLRTSTDGSKIVMGSAKGKAMKFGLNHIVFIAAIEAGLTEQADRNRFISFELLPPAEESRNKLRIPSNAELGQLGLRLAAIAIHNVHKAIELHEGLRQSHQNYDSRTVDAYSIPTAILAAAGRLDATQANRMLGRFLNTVDSQEQQQNDAEDLLNDIFSATFYCGAPRGVQTIGQMLVSALHPGTTDGGHADREHLEKCGIRLINDDNEPTSIFLSPRIVQKGLLRNSDQWAKGNIKRILTRLPGVQASKRRLSGRPIQGVTLPSSYIEDIEEDTGGLPY